MNKRTSLAVITFYAIITIITSCNNPVASSMFETALTTAPEITDDPERTLEEETIEMSLILNPIAVYEKYAVDDNNKVFGLTGKTRESIVLKDTEGNIHSFNDFFVKDNTVFFNVKAFDYTDPENPVEKIFYYFQTGEIITEETTISAFPEKPSSDFIEMGISPFSIIKFDYDGMDTSRVIRDGRQTAFKMIDDYYWTPEGLWFSVPETFSIRLKGVYFYPKVGNLSASPAMTGRIW